MMSLFHCEWERLWNRKSSLLFLFLIPLLVFITTLQSSANNQVLEKTDPQYSFWSNFPIMSIAEVFIFYFNIVTILVVIMSFTYEYRTGQLRMVLQRSYRFSSVFLAKYSVILIYLFSLMTFYFICTVTMGWFFFDSAQEVYLFSRPKPVTVIQSLCYSAAYYLLSFLSLAAVASVSVLIGVISKSSTSAFASTAGFLLISMLFPVLLEMLDESLGYSQYVYFSLIEIQYSGVVQMLTDNLFIRSWISAVMIVYIFLSVVISLLLFSKRDSIN